ncbi:MAG: cobalt ECF transporter T component CbiQ [Desulfobulbaceae bacterium]|nr:MAG: cobalt ECF transporter T component CbiQ [Desulfobulbaceae bacterium]
MEIKKTSLLQRWDPRCKLVALGALILAFAMVNDLRLVPLILVVPLLLMVVSGLTPAFILRRLRYPSLLLLFLLIGLPLAVGEEILLTVGPLLIRREGLEAAVLIGGRFLGIFLSALILLNTSPLTANIKAMRALGLPWILTDMALLVLRYLRVIGHDYRQMRIAMRIRGFKGNRLRLRYLQIVAWLTGSLLVRSYERSDWIYRAMRLRGYGHNDGPVSDFKAVRLDFMLLGVSLFWSLLIVSL